MSQHHSEFPNHQSGLNYALSDEPIFLNGMKVVFDQSASVYPVSLQPRFSELREQYSQAKTKDKGKKSNNDKPVLPKGFMGELTKKLNNNKEKEAEQKENFNQRSDGEEKRTYINETSNSNRRKLRIEKANKFYNKSTKTVVIKPAKIYKPLDGKVTDISTRKKSILASVRPWHPIEVKFNRDAEGKKKEKYVMCKCSIMKENGQEEKINGYINIDFICNPDKEDILKDIILDKEKYPNLYEQFYEFAKKERSKENIDCISVIKSIEKAQDVEKIDELLTELLTYLNTHKSNIQELNLPEPSKKPLYEIVFPSKGNSQTNFSLKKEIVMKTVEFEDYKKKILEAIKPIKDEIMINLSDTYSRYRLEYNIPQLF